MPRERRIRCHACKQRWVARVRSWNDLVCRNCHNQKVRRWYVEDAKKDVVNWSDVFKAFDKFESPRV